MSEKQRGELRRRGRKKLCRPRGRNNLQAVRPTLLVQTAADYEERGEEGGEEGGCPAAAAAAAASL